LHRRGRTHAWCHLGEDKPPELPPYITFDSQEPERITPFWCELLGVEVQTIRDEGRYVVLAPSRAVGGLMLVFQRVPETKEGKNRLHLDVLVDDLEVATKRVEALGGQWTEPGNTLELDGFRWRCMADPEGNEFCIMVLLA
jgi:predicted enzyme related to lactoylglutathione lyase